MEELLNTLIEDAEQRMAIYIKDLKMTSNDFNVMSRDALQYLVRQDLTSYSDAAADLLDRKLKIEKEKVKLRPPKRLAYIADLTCKQMVALAEQLQKAKQDALQEAELRQIKLCKPD